MKTIMILGAGVFQVAAIRKAVDLGYRVISVDYIPGNIGHRDAHQYVNASTTDARAVLAAARENRIDGIFTMASDIALPTVASVARELRLPGPGEELVRILTNKTLFRPFQLSLGLDTPASIEFGNFEQARANWQGGPIVTKPAISSGSRGVRRLEKLDSNCRPLFEQACQYSYNGKACIEEFIPGDDVSVEGFIHDGTVQHAFITNKYVRGFAVLGHEMPYKGADEQRDEILRQIQTVIDKTGYRAGPFDADFRINADRIVMLEITPRLGGNGMPLLAELVHGVKLVERSIMLAAGDEPGPTTLEHTGKTVPGATVLLHSNQTGTVTSVASTREMLARLSGVESLCLDLKAGQKVERFEHGGHIFGYCVLKLTNEAHFDGISRQVFDALKLEVT